MNTLKGATFFEIIRIINEEIIKHIHVSACTDNWENRPSIPKEGVRL